MDWYKRVVPNLEVRRGMLDALSFVPDAPMVSLQYRVKCGRWPNIKKPLRYTEKIQWYKLNYRDPLMTQCSDKYAVRSYVEECGFSGMLNELFAVYDAPEDIDFDALPDSFALKLNNGSGTNILVKDKASANLSDIVHQFRIWVDGLKRSNPGREWSYNNIVPKITAERLLPRDDNNDIPDYKFFCFEGRVFCSYVMRNYIDDHSKGELGFFDRDFNQLPVWRTDYGPLVGQIKPPLGYEDMVRAAEALSRPFPHVRVDFFSVEGRAVFAEMTFYNASGYTTFNPDSFDYELGDQFILPEPYDAECGIGHPYSPFDS